jgi:hypothetical protein
VGSNLIKLLEKTFNDPERYLGTVERNTEIKFVFLFLWALGWDPVSQIICGFHIHRNFIPGAGAARPADFALGLNEQLCLIGEVKNWFVTPIEWEKGLNQALVYQKACLSPKSFLTSGKEWIIISETGKTIFEHSITNVATSLDLLSNYLSPQTVSPIAGTELYWKYGNFPSKYEHEFKSKS